MAEQPYVGSVFIASNSYRHAAGNGLKVLPRVDEAIVDFVTAFHSLRFYVEAWWDCTADQFRGKLKEFLKAFKSGERTSGKYAVFVFVGHGGEGDVLYTEDGKTISTEEVVKGFTAELPKTVLKMFFIDACRGDGDVSVALPYCPAEEICLLARSTLPYQKAWTQGTYGVWSKALSELLRISPTVQSALTAVRNVLKQKYGLPEQQFPQYISNGFPDVAWIADVEYEGGYRQDPILNSSDLTTFRTEMEQYRRALHNDNGSAAMAGTIGGGLKGAQKQIQAGELSLPTVSKAAVSSQSAAGSSDDANDAILSQKVYNHPEYLVLLRKHVSKIAAAKGSAVLAAVGLDTPTIEMCFQDNPRSTEEAVQVGLVKWSGGRFKKPPTWKVLIKAMEDVGFDEKYTEGLKKDLGLH